MKKAISKSASARNRTRLYQYFSQSRVYFLLIMLVVGYLFYYLCSLHYQNYVLMGNRVKTAQHDLKQKKEVIAKLSTEISNYYDVGYVVDQVRKSEKKIPSNEVHVQNGQDIRETAEGKGN